MNEKPLEMFVVYRTPPGKFTVHRWALEEVDTSPDPVIVTGDLEEARAAIAERSPGLHCESYPNSDGSIVEAWR